MLVLLTATPAEVVVPGNPWIHWGSKARGGDLCRESRSGGKWGLPSEYIRDNTEKFCETENRRLEE